MTVSNNTRSASTGSSIEIPRTGTNSEMINVAGKIVAGVGAGLIIYKLGIAILRRFSKKDHSLPLTGKDQTNTNPNPPTQLNTSGRVSPEGETTTHQNTQASNESVRTENIPNKCLKEMEGEQAEPEKVENSVDKSPTPRQAKSPSRRQEPETPSEQSPLPSAVSVTQRESINETNDQEEQVDLGYSPDKQEKKENSVLKSSTPSPAKSPPRNQEPETPSEQSLLPSGVSGAQCESINETNDQEEQVHQGTTTPTDEEKQVDQGQAIPTKNPSRSPEPETPSEQDPFSNAVSVTPRKSMNETNNQEEQVDLNSSPENQRDHTTAEKSATGKKLSKKQKRKLQAQNNYGSPEGQVKSKTTSENPLTQTEE